MLIEGIVTQDGSTTVKEIIKLYIVERRTLQVNGKRSKSYILRCTPGRIDLGTFQDQRTASKEMHRIRSHIAKYKWLSHLTVRPDGRTGG